MELIIGIVVGIIIGLVVGTLMPARPVDGKLRNWIMSTRAQTKWNSGSMKEATSI